MEGFGEKISKKVKLLEFLENGSCLMGDLFAVFTAPYGSSQGQIARHVNVERTKREVAEYERKERRKFNILLCRLKADGLITCLKDGGRIKSASITSLGSRKAKKAREKVKYQTVAGGNEKKGTFKLIVFDIPEEYRRKREWLRRTLSYLGFQMLQKSVWIGRSEIPEDFVRDLKELSILSYVQILSIEKAGTLKRIG